MSGQLDPRSSALRAHGRWLVIAAVLCLVVAACGGHDSTETDAESSTSTTAADTSDGKGAPGVGHFGTLDEAVCGPGDASGSGDQGVSDDSIKIGTLTDAGNTIIPGLLQEFVDSAEAFVAWCNEAGGINGREIDLTIRDAKLVEGQQRIAEACASDFMLVGGGSGLDGPLAQPRVDCGLPQIPAFNADAPSKAADLQVNPTHANYPGYLNFGTMYQLAAKHFPDAIKKFAYLTATEGSGKTPWSVAIPQSVEESFGYNTVFSGATPPPPATVDNWRPYVEPMKTAGAELVVYDHIGDYVVPFMNSFSDIGFKPKAVLGNPGLYSKTFIDGNDALADIPTYVEVVVYPFEEADENPPTQQFLDLMDAELPGWSDVPKALAAQGWAAWLLFAQSAKACGSDLTRDCVMKEAAAAGEWDAGGLIAPGTISVGEPVGPWCAVMMRATPDGFEMDEEFTEPTDGIWNCDERNFIKTNQ